MSKKHLFLIGVLLGIVVFVAGCGGSTGTRDLSAPSSRLVGHWGYPPSNPAIELYFGELNEEGVGSYVAVAPTYGTMYQFYQVESESGDTVTIYIGPEHSTISSEYTSPFIVAADGSTLIDSWSDLEYSYIDSKSEP